MDMVDVVDMMERNRRTLRAFISFLLSLHVHAVSEFLRGRGILLPADSSSFPMSDGSRPVLYFHIIWGMQDFFAILRMCIAIRISPAGRAARSAIGTDTRGTARTDTRRTTRGRCSL